MKSEEFLSWKSLLNYFQHTPGIAGRKDTFMPSVTTSKLKEDQTARALQKSVQGGGEEGGGVDGKEGQADGRGSGQRTFNNVGVTSVSLYF